MQVVVPVHHGMRNLHSRWSIQGQVMTTSSFLKSWTRTPSLLMTSSAKPRKILTLFFIVDSYVTWTRILFSFLFLKFFLIFGGSDPHTHFHLDVSDMSTSQTNKKVGATYVDSSSTIYSNPKYASFISCIINESVTIQAKSCETLPCLFLKKVME